MIVVVERIGGGGGAMMIFGLPVGERSYAIPGI